MTTEATAAFGERGGVFAHCSSPVWLTLVGRCIDTSNAEALRHGRGVRSFAAITSLQRAAPTAASCRPLNHGCLVLSS